MKYFVLLSVILLLLSGCEQLVCNAPYIQVGSECCLDKDSNSICDEDVYCVGAVDKERKRPKIQKRGTF